MVRGIILPPVLGLAVIAAMIWISFVLDGRWRAKHPTDLPFRWGYFQALLFFPGGLMAFVVALRSAPKSWLNWLLLIAYVAVYGVCGLIAGYVLITQKKKWAWLFVVFAQLNLLTWVIDLPYGRNRWRELQ